MRTILFSHPALLGTVLFAALAAACASVPPATPPAAPTSAGVAERQPQAPRERLELKVRADFFAGMAGDDAAFARAMKVCDDALAANADDAEALVWRGAGHLFESGMAYRKGDVATGGTLWGRGLGEMDRAVALDPDDLGVRIPRGAALLGAAPHIPDPAVARTLYERAAADYQVALRVQEPYLTKLSTHAREELFFGLADAQAQLGDKEQARAYFERLVRDVPDSQLLPYARAWLSGAKPDPRPGCTGCHFG
jgi:tetratricopeptide (TPR) repeat protein